MMLARLLVLVSLPAAGHAQVTGDTGRQIGQSSGRLPTTDDDDDGMDLGLLGRLGRLGLRRRETVNRIDTRPTRPYTQAKSAVPVRFRSSGGIASIVLSIIATVVLNLLLRGCT